MNKNIYWFSLIEVIVATSIITISVFWVYKLISENTKIINKSSNNIQVNNVFFNTKDCIENIWFDNYNKTVWSKYYFNFWNDLINCNTWSITDKTSIDWLDYLVQGEILDSWISNWLDYIKWLISIESPEIKTLTWEYLQIKK